MTDKHPDMLQLPVIDQDYLDEQIAKSKDMPIQFAEGFEPNPWWPRLIVAGFILAIAVIALSQQIADFLILSR